MGTMPIVITIKSAPAQDGTHTVDAENIIGGGIHRTKEHRILDWTPVERVDANFGRLRVQNGWSTLSDVRQQRTITSHILPDRVLTPCLDIGRLSQGWAREGA